jgi:hypothetical protein
VKRKFSSEENKKCHQDRPGNQLMKNNLTSGSACLDQEPATNVIDYGKHVKIYTDGSKMVDEVGYAVVKEEHTIKKRILLQNTMFSVEHSAIIEAIQPTPTKNPKTQTIRMMLDHEGPKITLLWVPSHVGIPGNEKANQ